MFLTTGNKSTCNCVEVIKTGKLWNLYFSTKKSLPCGAFDYNSSIVRVKRGILTLYLSSLNMLITREYSCGLRVIYYVDQPHPICSWVTLPLLHVKGTGKIQRRHFKWMNDNLQLIIIIIVIIIRCVQNETSSLQMANDVYGVL